jgi:hypothetical protein
MAVVLVANPFPGRESRSVQRAGDGLLHRPTTGRGLAYRSADVRTTLGFTAPR